MNRRISKLVMMLLLVIMLMTIALPIASAGTPVRCGSACYTNSVDPTPPSE